MRPFPVPVPAACAHPAAPPPNPLPGFLPSWPGSPFPVPPSMKGNRCWMTRPELSRRQREAVVFLEGPWSRVGSAESYVWGRVG